MSSPIVEKHNQDYSPEELTSWLKERIAEHVQLSPEEIDPAVPLANYGLDSLYALTVVTQIEDHLGLTLEPTVMWDAPTLDALVEVIRAEMAHVA
ncbi:acyl carrier protein [Streptomyces sp. NPDC005761]|uniref:acyl carrier protein n=1 Tax=unclassified Streptomyces TaxID=2593676 RepID=UPI0033F7B92A